MKSKIMIAAALTLTVLLGCQSPRGGGLSNSERFKINTPFDTTIKQGETRNVTIPLQRGEYFKQDVKLEIRASEGISVTPATALVKGSDQPNVQIQITAAKDANLGEYRIYIKGTPTTGEQVSVEFDVKVVTP
jgi:uncharacterized membrane protein